jgi:hypothetical protein
MIFASLARAARRRLRDHGNSFVGAHFRYFTMFSSSVEVSLKLTAADLDRRLRSGQTAAELSLPDEAARFEAPGATFHRAGQQRCIRAGELVLRRAGKLLFGLRMLHRNRQRRRRRAAA